MASSLRQTKTLVRKVCCLSSVLKHRGWLHGWPMSAHATMTARWGGGHLDCPQGFPSGRRFGSGQQMAPVSLVPGLEQVLLCPLRTCNGKAVRPSSACPVCCCHQAVKIFEKCRVFPVERIFLICFRAFADLLRKLKETVCRRLVGFLISVSDLMSFLGTLEPGAHEGSGHSLPRAWFGRNSRKCRSLF